MKTLEDAFTTLLGRQPGDAEKQALFRARDAFQIKNNDALWLLLAILGHYETLYSKIPSLIADSAAKVTGTGSRAGLAGGFEPVRCPARVKGAPSRCWPALFPPRSP